jgi:hypothetical protein
MRFHIILQDASAEQGWSDDNYAFHKTVFAPTTPQFIVNEQVCPEAYASHGVRFNIPMFTLDTDVW